MIITSNIRLISTLAGVLLAFLTACGQPQSPSAPSPRVHSGYNNPATNNPVAPQTTDTNPTVVPNAKIDRFAFDQSTLQRAGQKITGFDFDYTYGQNNLNATIPYIRIKVTNPSVTALGTKLGVVLGGYALSDSATYVTSSTAAALDQSGVLTLAGENMKPATIYKIRLHFFDRSQATPQYIGSSSRTYQFATDATTDDLTKARVRIVMRGFHEEDDWALNRYDRSKRYADDAGNGWCHIFYNWTIKPFLKTRSGSDNTHYSSSYWNQYNALTNGSALVTLSQREPIMGDYFHVGSHAAMILAYDTAKQRFVTLEGNFNSSVEFYTRSTNEFSWVGHIKPEMVLNQSGIAQN